MKVLIGQHQRQAQRISAVPVALSEDESWVKSCAIDARRALRMA
jgi:hypothetical protein